MGSKVGVDHSNERLEETKAGFSSQEQTDLMADGLETAPFDPLDTTTGTPKTAVGSSDGSKVSSEGGPGGLRLHLRPSAARNPAFPSSLLH